MKVGIVTIYYKNSNYGANLQAYALALYLEHMGYDAEQICCSLYRPELFSAGFRRLSHIKRLKLIVRKALYGMTQTKNRLLSECPQYHRCVRRQKKIYNFNSKRIRHSKVVYYSYEHPMIAENYDVFISGSDQVWNTQWGVVPIYFLNCVQKPKIKMSYAASLGKEQLSEDDIAVYKKYLADYDAISVREEDAVALLKDAAPMAAEWVVDPTLLLSREDWDGICGERMVQEPYLFCYFLGMDTEERNLAAAYAKEHRLKLVTMPFLLEEMFRDRAFRKFEKKFGDEQLYDVSPEQFLSLIRYADCVFTDSFHGALFSGLYQREYFIFGRGQMGSRIVSLTKLYETPEHYCVTPEQRTMGYLSAQKPIDYSRDLKLLKEMQQKSKDFLAVNLKKAERQFSR